MNLSVSSVQKLAPYSAIENLKLSQAHCNELENKLKFSTLQIKKLNQDVNDLKKVALKARHIATQTEIFQDLTIKPEMENLTQDFDDLKTKLSMDWKMDSKKRA